MTTKKQKIFLTGSAGFIGKNIHEGLKDKYEFFAPSHKQLDLLDFLKVEKYFAKHGPFDYVLHTAIVGGSRKSGDDEKFAFESMRMFFNLAYQEKYFKKFFYFGSGIEYGKEKPIKNAREDDFGKRIPMSNWGLYKYICAKSIEKKEKFVNLRLFGVFGKYEDFRIRFISNSICRNILNMPIVINQNILMDYLFIEDFMKILERLMKGQLRYNVYNITPDQKTDLIAISDVINRISENKVEVKIKHKGFSNEYTGSNYRLKKEFDDITFTNLDDSIKALYFWYLERRKKISKKDMAKDYF